MRTALLPLSVLFALSAYAADPPARVHTVQAGPFRVEVTLDAVVEAKRTAQVSFRPQTWSELIIETVVPPGEQVKAGLSPAARRVAGQRLPQGAATLLGRGAAPRWTLLTGPMSPDSSTAIRARGSRVTDIAV